ncbi:MAG: BTAD domain-containing putative transcriptional regulator [Pseudomonadota bacterium]
MNKIAALARVAPLHLSLIGGFALFRGDEPVSLASVPARGLLGVLALSAGQSATRDALAALLWGDHAEARARQNLRQTLHVLRKALPPGCLLVSRDRLALNPGALRTDEAAILDDLGRGRVPGALLSNHSLPETLLTGHDRLGSGFVTWLRLRQKALEDQLRDHLSAIMDSAPRIEALRAARALMLLDPTEERAARSLMNAARSTGDVAGALRVYDRLWTHLGDEFDMEPSAETQALVVSIKQMDATGSVTAMPETQRPAHRPSLLIAPLSDGNSDAIAGIFRAELLARLARFRELDVRDGVVATRPADFALTLCAVTSHDRTTLTARIAATQTGTVIWSDRISLARTTWQDTLGQLAGALAAASGINLSRARLADLQSGQGARDAVDEWLLGQIRLDRFRPDDWQAAAAHFERARNIDPGFAKAHSSLAQVRNIEHLVHVGRPLCPARLRCGLASANAAVEADPFDGQAHLARAWAAMLLRRFGQAELSFSEALQCNPDDPSTVISAALGAAFRGDAVLADSLAQRFQREGWTTTRSNWGYLANIRFLGGDLPGAIEACDSADDGIINMPAWKAAALFLSGDRQGAADAWLTFETLARAHWTAGCACALSSTDLLDWFSRLFPIRDPEHQRHLAAGARGALETYLHCATR